MEILVFSVLCVVIIVLININKNKRYQESSVQHKNINPEDIKAPFKMTVSDIFRISGRGIVLTGVVEKGIVNVGEDIEIRGVGESRIVTVAGIEKFRKVIQQAQAGDNIGILLKDIDENFINRGQILIKPGTMNDN